MLSSVFEFKCVGESGLKCRSLKLMHRWDSEIGEADNCWAFYKPRPRIEVKPVTGERRPPRRPPAPVMLQSSPERSDDTLFSDPSNWNRRLARFGCPVTERHEVRVVITRRTFADSPQMRSSMPHWRRMLLETVVTWLVRHLGKLASGWVRAAANVVSVTIRQPTRPMSPETTLQSNSFKASSKACGCWERSD